MQVCLIPIAGIIGTLVYNRFKVSKDVITIIFLIFLSISFVIFPFTKGILATVVLLVGSFFLYGPHVFLVTTMPTRFVDQQVVAASTGFIDGMGYIGTVLVGVIIPIIVKSSGGDNDWTNVFILWAVLSIITAIFVGVIYFNNFRFNSAK